MASYVMLYEEIGAEFFHNYIISDASFWRIPDEIYELEAQRYLQSDTLDVNVVFSGTTGSLGNYEGVSEFYDFIKNRLTSSLTWPLCLNIEVHMGTYGLILSKKVYQYSFQCRANKIN